MKKAFVLTLFSFMVFGFVCQAQKLAPADQVIKMEKAQYDLGKIKHNEPVTFYMQFTNISKKPVVVENVTAGCGCTVPDKPVAPIMPGKSGKIKVVYSAVANGKFNKDVTIKVAGAEPKTIFFTGETYE